MISLKKAIPIAIMVLTIFVSAGLAGAADEEACLGCHKYPGLATKDKSEKLRHFHLDGEDFNRSIHGLLTCRGCHIDILRVPHEGKKHKVNCGISCHRYSKGEVLSHGALYNRFLETPHGKALERGPDCLYCHPRNAQLDYKETRRRDWDMLCTECHLKGRTQTALDKSPAPMVSEDVFHRLTIIRNFRDAPGCIDCHTAHDIHSAGDIKSPVHPENIKTTCSGAEGVSKECHSKTTERFLSASVHDAALADRFQQRAGSGEMWLLVMVLMAPLMVHMVFDAIRAPRVALDKRDGEEEKASGISSRMTPHQRALHSLLIVLFLITSAGGLTLRLNERDLAARLIEVVGGIEAMATIHLYTGLALAALIAYHIVSLLFLSIKRDWAINELILMPDANDLKNIIQNAKFFLFLSADFPRFGKYSFVQKFDYFAGLAGLSLMLATGLAVGFPERAALLFSPAYIEDIRTFHITLGYLLIFVFLVWHVYNNLLSPGKFFANWSWISGSMPEGLIATYHAAYYEEALQRDQEQRLEREKVAEERSMQRTIKKQSQRLEEYLNAGNRLAKQEKFDEAIEQYRMALDLLPKFPQAQYNLATVYQKAGNLAQAAVEYRKFIEMDPFNAMVEKVRSILHEIEGPGKGESADDE